MKKYINVSVNLILILAVAVGAIFMLKNYGLKQEFGYVDVEGDNYIDIYPEVLEIYSINGVEIESRSVDGREIPLPVRLTPAKYYYDIGLRDPYEETAVFEKLQFDFGVSKISLKLEINDLHGIFVLRHTMLYMAGFSSMGILAVLLLVFCALNLFRVYTMFKVTHLRDESIVKMDVAKLMGRVILRYTWTVFSSLLVIAIAGVFFYEIFDGLNILKDFYFLIVIAAVLIIMLVIALVPILGNNYIFKFVDNKIVVTKGRHTVLDLKYKELEYELRDFTIPAQGIRTRHLILLPINSEQNPFTLRRDEYDADLFVVLCKKVQEKIKEKSIEVLTAEKPKGTEASVLENSGKEVDTGNVTSEEKILIGNMEKDVDASVNAGKISTDGQEAE